METAKTSEPVAEKTHWKKLDNPNYLGAWSLPNGNDMTVEILRIEQTEVVNNRKKDIKTIAILKDHKPMILNATNKKKLERIFKTPYIEDWPGKRFTVYIEHGISSPDGPVDGLRIRDTVPSLPELTPTHSAWPAVIEAIRSGKYTMAQVLKKYSVSEDNQALITAKNEAE